MGCTAEFAGKRKKLRVRMRGRKWGRQTRKGGRKSGRQRFEWDSREAGKEEMNPFRSSKET